LAVQLVATLNALPSQQVYDQLAAALSALDDLQGLDTQQLWEAVQQVQTEVLQVLTDAGLVDGVTTATASASPTPSASAAVVVTAAPTPGESATATSEPTAQPTTPAPTEASPSPTEATPAATPSG
jgi:hypothetical protein